MAFIETFGSRMICISAPAASSVVLTSTTVWPPFLEEADLTGCGESLLADELECRVAGRLLVGLDGGRGRSGRPASS